MCCVEFLVKYVLFFANLVFSLAGLVLAGLGIAVLVNVNSSSILEATVQAVAISVIVLGSVIFLIALFGCCGAIRESRCFLMMYSIIMVLLAASKIYLTVVLFQGLSNVQELVEDWLGTAFNNNNLREAFHVLELSFSCCGTTGPDSYTGILAQLPPSCCKVPQPDNTCSRLDAFRGCNIIVSDYFDSFGSAIGGILITVIAVEVIAFTFGFFLCHSIGNKRRKTV